MLVVTKKNIFILAVAFIFGLISVWPALALENAEPLPINLDIRNANAQKQRDLIGQYGESGFYLCFTCAPDKLDNPFAVAACLRGAGYCLADRSAPAVNCSAGEAPSAGRCVALSDACRENFGEAAYYLGFEENGHYTCGCQDGYIWNNNKTRCIQAACPDDYLYYSAYRNPDGGFLHGRCVTRDDACRIEFGEHSFWLRLEGDGGYLCACAAGWEWSEDRSACSRAVPVLGTSASFEDETVYPETVEREKAVAGKPDKALAARLSGRILLQVEENGEAWYMNPSDQKRYFLSSPDKAFALMRDLGLGATHDFLTTHSVYPDHVLGKILIDVDDLGRAYYISPSDRLAYYLGSPAEAFSVMRKLGLGISNNDIRKLEVK